LTPYRVNLDVFAGPMDLLLYLIRKDEVDIYDIPIASITDQYIQYIEILKNFDIDLAGDFLVMASSLLQIKSAMLLPKAEPDSIDAEDFEDPRTELIRQLLEYKKFKDAANLLDACAQQQQQRQPRPAVIIDKLKDSSEPEVDLDQVSVWDLLSAFDTLLQATGASFDISHIQDDTPIDLYQIELLHRLQSEGAMPFARIFESRPNRLVMVGLFLALLELIRDGLVGCEQSQPNGDIHIKALTDEPAELVIQRIIMASSNRAEDEQAESQQGQIEQTPVIPIVELVSNEETPQAEAVLPAEDAYPIVELPAKSAKEETTEILNDYDQSAGQDEQNN
jgi:segregation and condensation protein A